MSRGALLRSIASVPVRILPWPEIVADLGYPGPVAVGKVLGVDPVFVDEWSRSGHAPKWACLALWWLTRWGQSQVNEKAVRDAQLAVGFLACLERERNELLAELRRKKGAPTIAEPEAFEGLPFSLMPALADWSAPVAGQAVAARFLAGGVEFGRRPRSTKRGLGRSPREPGA